MKTFIAAVNIVHINIKGILMYKTYTNIVYILPVGELGIYGI
jgi:hypothetical protein